MATISLRFCPTMAAAAACMLPPGPFPRMSVLASVVVINAVRNATAHAIFVVVIRFVRDLGVVQA